MVRFGLTKIHRIKQEKNTINVMRVYFKHSISVLQILHLRRLQMLQLNLSSKEQKESLEHP